MHMHVHEHEHHEHHSPEEAVALLQYMIGHNRHHIEELHDLAHSIDGDAESLIHDACVDFQVGCEKLDEALKLLKGE